MHYEDLEQKMNSDTNRSNGGKTIRRFSPEAPPMSLHLLRSVPFGIVDDRRTTDALHLR